MLPRGKCVQNTGIVQRILLSNPSECEAVPHDNSKRSALEPKIECRCDTDSLLQATNMIL
jgi:hypothetical protein